MEVCMRVCIGLLFSLTSCSGGTALQGLTIGQSLLHSGLSNLPVPFYCTGVGQVSGAVIGLVPQTAPTVLSLPTK